VYQQLERNKYRNVRKFRKSVYEAVKERPEYIRLGQAVFNYIDAEYGVARILQFRYGLDCYYYDDITPYFIEKAYELIVENEKKGKYSSEESCRGDVGK
jgi:hypothetical protein